MHIAAMIFGIIGGLILMGIAFLGYSLGSLGKSTELQFISVAVPTLAFLGAGIVMKNGIFGGILMLASAGGVILIIGNNPFGIFLSFLLTIGGLLGIFSGQRVKSASTITTNPTEPYNIKPDSNNVQQSPYQSKGVEDSTSSTFNSSASITARFDRDKWSALLKYDKDIALIADKLQPLGQKWMDELASSYLVLNDKQYLPEIEHKIIVAARREAEEKEQKAIAIAKAEAERKEQLRIRTEQQKKAYEEQRKAHLEEQERRSQARKDLIKLWRNWLTGKRKVLIIGGFAVFFIGIIVVALWQRSIKIKEEEARLNEERRQERIARDQAEERARTAEETARKEIERQRIAREQAEEIVRIAEERRQIDERRPKTDQEEQPRSELPVTSISAPLVQVGDSYIYESIDAYNIGPSITTKRTVTSNSDKIILSVVNINSANAKTRNLYFNHEWNLIGTRNPDNSGLNYSPPLKYFDFPLYPGKAWQQTTTETNIKTGATRIHKISGIVGQLENVSVPAGTFRAIKISLQTELFDPTTSEKISGTDESWYVPEIRRSIKSLTTGKDAKKRLTQLIQYELKTSENTSAKHSELDTAKSWTSLNCSEAKMTSEIAVCNNTDLIHMDKELALLYQSHLKDYKSDPNIAKKLHDTQRSWLVERNRCGSDISCLRVRYRERTAWLREFEGYD